MNRIDEISTVPVRVRRSSHRSFVRRSTKHENRLHRANECPQYRESKSNRERLTFLWCFKCIYRSTHPNNQKKHKASANPPSLSLPQIPKTHVIINSVPNQEQDPNSMHKGRSTRILSFTKVGRLVPSEGVESRALLHCGPFGELGGSFVPSVRSSLVVRKGGGGGGGGRKRTFP